ncbi:hypothetical protein [Candidatus Terasakiella magnetica]|nr:hypothetical protein [Candidatus Terasakiella magnetica]
MAFGGVLMQGYHLVRGAQLTLFAPEQVMLIFYQYHPEDTQKYIRIGARVAYANSGHTGHNAVVQKETVSFTLGGQTYNQVWQSVHKFKGTEARVEDEIISEAKPEPIQAGNAISREIYFAPHKLRCAKKQSKQKCDEGVNYLTKESFINLLSDVEQLEFTFSSKIFDQPDPIKVSCSIDVDFELISKLAAFGSAAPNCWPLDV